MLPKLVKGGLFANQIYLIILKNDIFNGWGSTMSNKYFYRKKV